MNRTISPTAAVLLHKAESDEALLSLDLVSDSIVGFHAQQAAEKLLKALLTQLNVPYEHTHNLERLVLLLNAHGELLPATSFSFDELTDFAVEYRYSFLPPGQSVDRAQLAETVRTLREHIVTRIALLAVVPSPLGE